MSGLTEERKRQIRAEEHARVEREEEVRRVQEEQYRAEVRREEEYRADVRREEEYRAEVRRDIERDRAAEVTTPTSSAASTVQPSMSTPASSTPVSVQPSEMSNTPAPAAYAPSPSYASTPSPYPLAPAPWTPPSEYGSTWTRPPAEYAPTWAPPTPMGPAPSNVFERPPRLTPPRGGRLYKLGGVLILIGLVLTATSLWVMPHDKPEDGALVANGDGELAPAEATWNPADLAYNDLYIRAGHATVVPDEGITNLADLAKPPGAERTPSAPALGPHMPPDDSAHSIDALLELVPSDATIVVALDLPQLQRSPALTSLVTRIFAQTPLGDVFMRTLQAGGADLTSGRGVLLAGLPRVGSAPQTLTVFRGPLDTAAVTAHLTSQGAVSSTDGTDTLLALPQTTVLVREDMIAFGGAPAIAKARTASAGTSIADASPLGEPIAQMRSSPAGFAVVSPNAAFRKQLGGVVPDLASAQWVALGIDTTAGIVFTARAALPSADIASRAAAQLEASKVTIGVPKASFTSNGNIVEMVAPVDESVLAGLVVTRAQA